MSDSPNDTRGFQSHRQMSGSEQGTRWLDGRLALVTGAAGGIGGHIARSLLDAGATVVAACRDEGTFRSRYPGLADEALLLPVYVDLERPSDIRDMAKGVRAHGRSIDIMVLAAGTIVLGPIAGMEQDDFDRLYRVNLRAPQIILRELSPLLTRPGGHVIVINSTAIQSPRSENAAYAAIELALARLSDAWRDQLGPDVQLTSVHPGRTDTPMQQRIMEWEGSLIPSSALLPPQAVADSVMSSIQAGVIAEVTAIWLRPQRR
jgi:NAD(P)-dependent dehydrogenase (short-subunit alcohol dehydrogenase family)